MANLAIEGQDITYYYGKKGKTRPILDKLDIHIQEGHIYGLLGPSGCGKTTLLRCFIGQLPISSGDIRIYGRMPGEPNFFIPGKGVGYMPQELSLCLSITTEETLWYFGQIYRMNSTQIKHRINFLTDLLNIKDKSTVLCKFSGGQKRRVSFATALIHQPPLLILDEPTVGVDPVLRKTIWNHLNYMANKAGTTIIITTHYIDEVRTADMVGFMKDGRLLTEMKPEKLLDIYKVSTLEEAFLNLTLEKCQQRKPSVNETSCAIYDSDNEFFRRKRKRHKFKNYDFEINEMDSLINNTDYCELTESMLTRDTSVDKTASEKLTGSFTRLSTLMRKNFVDMRRNIPLLILRIMDSTFHVLVYYLAIQSIMDVPIAVVNMDNGSYFSMKFLDQFDKTLKQIPYSNLSLAKESVVNGETSGVIYIEQNFLLNLIERNQASGTMLNKTNLQAPVKLYLDMTSKQITYAITIASEKAFEKFIELTQKGNKNSLLIESFVVVEKPLYGSKDAPFIHFLIPNILIGSSYITAVTLTTLILMRDRKERFTDRLLVAGVKHIEVLLSILFNMFCVTLLQTATILTVVLWILQIPNQGSVIWLYINTLIAATCALSLGIIFSTACDSEMTVVMMSILFHAPVTAYSGVLWPKEGMPAFFKKTSFMLPLTPLTETSRNIMFRGWTITEHQTWTDILIPFVWIIIPIFISLLIFKCKY